MLGNKAAATQRRVFIKGVAIAGASVAIATISHRAASLEDSGQSAKSSDLPKSQGYQKTAHVKSFYATARV